jgi:hypothetical protein
MKTLRILLLCFISLTFPSLLKAQEDAYLYSGSQAKHLADIKNSQALRTCIASNAQLLRELSNPAIQAFFLPGGKVNIRGKEDWYVFFPQKERANAFMVSVQESEFKCLHSFAEGPLARVYHDAVRIREAQAEDDGTTANLIATDLFKKIDALQADSQSRAETEQIVGAVIGNETKFIAADNATRLKQFNSSYKHYVLTDAIKALQIHFYASGDEKVLTYGGPVRGMWDLTDLSFESASPFFRADEFRDLRALSAVLRKSDKLSAILKGYLGPATQTHILAFPTQSLPSPQLQEEVAKDLNVVLAKENLVTQPAFASLQVTQAIKAAGTGQIVALSGENLINTNRLVLEEAFPEAIPKDLESNRPLIINGVPYAKAWKGSTLVLFRLEKPEFFSQKDLRPEKVQIYLANQASLCSEKTTNNTKCRLTAIQ